MDARLLLKASKSNPQRIDHPHIKYNSFGKISCIPCGVPIKSEITWKAHILSKTHKENAARGTTLLKRIQTQAKNGEPLAKRSKTEVDQSKPEVLESSEGHNLVSETSDSTPTTSKEEENVQNGPLPEGFFDDARRDAEARNVPFKDKMDAEMEAFQRELTTLNQESEQIQEEESKEMVVARNLAEIDKEIAMWEKVRDLEIMKEISLSKKKIVKDENISAKTEGEDYDDNDSSDIDEDEMNDFRFKSGVR